MSGFPIFDLDTIHLEKVINKLQEKSCFRLQQTCRDMAEIIRTNRNIVVNLDDSFHLYFKNDHQYGYVVDSCLVGIGLKMCERHSLGLFCGGRFRSINAPRTTDRFDVICDLLKKYRITCEKLTIYGQMNNEQTQKFVRILKPTELSLNCACRVQYEALRHGKTLKTVEIKLEAIEAITAIKSLFPVCQDLTIIASRSKTSQLPLVKDILHILYSIPSPNLRKFHLFITWNAEKGQTLSTGELSKMFRGFTSNVEKHVQYMLVEENEYKSFRLENLPSHFSPKIVGTVIFPVNLHGYQQAAINLTLLPPELSASSES